MRQTKIIITDGIQSRALSQGDVLAYFVVAFFDSEAGVQMQISEADSGNEGKPGMSNFAKKQVFRAALLQLLDSEDGSKLKTLGLQVKELMGGLGLTEIMKGEPNGAYIDT